MSKALNLKYLLPLFIIGASLVVSYALIVQAQTEPTDAEITAKGITFPIPELGNCGSKDECRDYCNQPGNMEACINFAQSHGLMNKAEAEHGLKFQKRILSGNTPGGCNSPESCRILCSDVNNLEVCLKFADEQGFKEEKIDEARKILAYVKSGGRLPGGCTSKESCQAYCGDFNNAEECFAFAERVGLAEAEFEGKEKLEPEKFKKFIELAKSGETPGGCKSKEQCESYCSNQSNVEECIAFGQKMGFIDEKKAELFRKTGGKGPGGCTSEESCKAYCNDPGNQEACFKFAEEHNLIDREELKHAKEGFVRLRQGLEQAPPEVAQCLKSTLGPNIIQDIQSGNLTPGPQIGERVKSCFEKFGHRGDAREGFNQVPPEMMSCVKEKLGDVFEKAKSGELTPTPEMADAFRICGEKLRLLQGPPGEEGREGDREGGGRDISNFLRSAPPGAAGCLKEKLGDDFERAKQEGTPPGQEVKATLRECFEEFKPERPEPREFKPSDYEDREGIKPAGLQDFRNFIRHGGTSTPSEDGSRPGLDRETFEKFRQEGVPQQSQGEFQKQYDQQYQQQYQTPPPTEPTSPPPTAEPAPQTQGSIFQAIKNFFGF